MGPGDLSVGVAEHLGEPLAELQPGTQQPHLDGPHLFQGTHGYEQAQNPAHCLNVFLPLVDVTLENGPTEFWPGSHCLERARDAFNGNMPSVALAGKRGDAIVFDYRVVHRGMPNESDEARPSSREVTSHIHGAIESMTLTSWGSVT